MSERLRVGLLVAIALLAYANALVDGFTLDDNLYVLTNPMVTTPTVGGLFVPTRYSNVFRPMTFASLALDWAIGGDHPIGYHMHNILLHALVVLLLYQVLGKLLESIASGATIAWVAALIFAVHPLHTEAVTSITGRSEVLAMAFVLGAWILHLLDWPILVLVSFVLALLAKESAVAFVPLVLVGDYARGKGQALPRYAAIAATAVAYLGLLWKVQGGRFGETAVNFEDNPLAHVPAAVRIPNALHVAWKYVWLHFCPAILSCDYSYNAIPLYVSWRRNAPAILATAIVLILWFWALWTRRKEWFLAGGIYLAGFAATSNILIPTGTIMGERLAYLPSAGFCLLVALVWIRLENRYKTLAWAVLALAVACLGTRTVVRNRDWHDNFSIFSAAVRAVPGSAKMHGNLGVLHYTRGEMDAASKETQTALRIYPDLPEIIGQEALIESRKGHDQEAKRLLEKALSMDVKADPNYDYMAVNLAAVEMKLGENREALKVLDQEIATSPTYSRAWSNRAVIRYHWGDTAQARSDAETALRLDPSNTQAQNLIGLLNGSSPITSKQ